MKKSNQRVLIDRAHDDADTRDTDRSDTDRSDDDTRDAADTRGADRGGANQVGTNQGGANRGRANETDAKLIGSDRDYERAIDDAMGFPGWNGTRMDEWIDMLGSLDSHGPNGSRAVPSADVFNLVVTASNDHRRERYVRVATRVASRVNARAIERIGRPVVTVVVG